MIIATRTLTLRDPKGEVRIPIRIQTPRPDGAAWMCGYEIEWPHGTWKSAAAGVDAVQALVLALQKIGTELYASEYHRSGRLMWGNPTQGYGFPLPGNARDMLKGDDARFF